ncbi:hypothetical protein [Cellulophaga fucicola]|uniref:Uncharacterized protein n=1 Tax=Cellulophaga fucicola TaxID=76595 RepID=A0A1K1NNP0_9FLAO|nr:hypothetical protein [Cellulophaga fucicola]SFW36885.1 hypothetical protein SAMN05660313_01274 [Cellulophaga fucicola]
MRRVIYFLLIIISTCYSCRQKNNKIITKNNEIIDSVKTYTQPSKLTNEYVNFNSPNAINRIAEIENEYFNDYRLNSSKYYGTKWYDYVGLSMELSDSITIFDRYSIEKNNMKLDSMHCTIFAVKGLESGFGKEFEIIKKHHIDIWSDREYAGWSLAYILTKHYNWKAYLFISKYSDEYDICVRNYKKDKKYHVWKQPNIPIEKIFDFDDDKDKINSLLKLNEFGWGFSNQGWHTWITRFDYLKECNWLGAPAKKYDTEGNQPLFLKTKFIDYYDYDSHIIVFPPKKNKTFANKV